jgi:transposase
MSVLFDHLGVDISKATLDCCYHKTHCQIPNNAAGFARLIGWIKKLAPGLRVACESTGFYHLAMVEALQQARLEVCVLNPKPARHYAVSCGRLAKTDKIDAALLADFANHFQPAVTAPLSAAHRQLVAAIERRSQLIELITAEQNRLGQTTDSLARSDLQAHLDYLQKRQAHWDAQIKKQVAADATLQTKVALLSKVQGVGPVTAATVVALVPELGQLSRSQAAAMAGLAPINRDSGSFQGKRMIGGGRPKVRRALYMAALVASRHNPILRDFYQRLIAKGKAPKVALTALMRKLLIHLNALLRNLQPLPA